MYVITMYALLFSPSSERNRASELLFASRLEPRQAALRGRLVQPDLYTTCGALSYYSVRTVGSYCVYVRGRIISYLLSMSVRAADALITDQIALRHAYGAHSEWDHQDCSLGFAELPWPHECDASAA